jgi:hypothetical protein
LHRLAPLDDADEGRVGYQELRRASGIENFDEVVLDSEKGRELRRRLCEGIGQ